jgi:hypothetical protein
VGEITNVSSGTESDELLSAHATRKECVGELPDHIAILKQSGYAVAGGFPGSYEVLGTKGNERRRVYCPLTTVDPRGPRGK